MVTSGSPRTSTSLSSSSSSGPLLPPAATVTRLKRIKTDKTLGRGSPSEMPPLHPTVGEYSINYDMHSQHRAKLVERMRATEGVVSRGVLLFSGGSSPQRDETDHEPIFRQESTFQYLFGVRDPDCFGTVELATGKATVYIPRIPAEYAIWIGKVMPFEHFQAMYKVDQVLFVEDIASSIKQMAPEKVSNMGINISVFNGKAEVRTYGTDIPRPRHLHVVVV